MKTCLWLLFLCLTGSLQVVAQNGGASSALCSPLKVVMPPMTKGDGGNAVSVNGNEYDTWANAVTAINNNSSIQAFDIVLLKSVYDAKEMPNKACTISGSTNSVNFAFVNEEGYLTCIQMVAPLTFKDIKLQIWQIAANGHALTFDEGVTVVSEYEEGIKGIKTIWGGSTDKSNVDNTNIIIKSGQFQWVYGGSTSDATANTGDVTGKAKVTISGGTINGAIFGGSWGGTCGDTEVIMTGGTTAWIYGGCDVGDITNKAKLTISGDALINSAVYGSSNEGTCGSTEVVINGGIFKENIFAGGFKDVVTNGTSLIVDGAKMDPIEEASGTYSGGTIYGGGFGNASDGDKGKVGSTQVVIKNLASGSKNVNIYGGGLHSKVTGNTDVTIEGGEIRSVYGSSYNEDPAIGLVGGNINMLIKGGTIEVVSAAREQKEGAAIAVTGTMNITVEGGKVENYIRSGNNNSGSAYKACTLTIKDLGTDSNPYTIPGIYELSNLVLDNSIVKSLDPKFITTTIYDISGFTVKDDHPIYISGSGKLVGTNIFVHTSGGSTLSPNKPLVVAENLPKTTTFTGFVKLENNLPVTRPIYKAGQTYRLKEDDGTLYTVNITAPEAELGTLAVKWDEVNGADVILEDGDQAPASTKLTVTATPADEGIEFTTKNNGTTFTGTEVTLDANAAITVDSDILPLNLEGKNSDITISKAGDIWKYTKAIATKTIPDPISFNGTIQNTLADSYRMLIDNTANGALAFENAKINSTTAAAPALTIESGAKVSFSGSLEVKTEEASQYGIVNNGNLAITGTSTTITSKNTTGSSENGIKVEANASMVSEAETTLTTSGMSNDGTVVVKEGATANTTGGTPLQKTYLVTVTNPGNGNQIVIKAGGVIDVKDQDKVADKTKLTVSGAPVSGYTLESITVTPKNGTTTALSNNEIYDMPENEVTFAATFKQSAPPYIPTYYNVTIPTVEGVTTTPKAGTYVVEEGYNFSFNLTLNAGYENSKPIIKANDVVIEPRESDGKYIIRNINETTDILIEGIMKDDPTANAEVDGIVKVQAVGSTLHIYLPKEETALIFTASGLLYKEEKLPAGNTQLQLAKGMYLVKINNTTYKAVVR